jgi:hypothetical protein
MRRLTARLLLLFALVGNLIPLAMAITATPPRACCRRMAHRCHESAASEAGQLVLRDPCYCNNHPRHAAITAQWAHPQTRTAQAGAPVLERLDLTSELVSASAQPASLHSSRAPPSSSIAGNDTLS